MQRTCIAILMSAMITSCSVSHSPLVSYQVTQAPIVHEVVERGVASWYGPGFHGRKTSNGERFNKYAMTAAHPTLPFGSLVEVTNTRTGKKVQVRINDRGPFIKHRIIDLSYAAAKSVGMSGLDKVELRIIQIART